MRIFYNHSYFTVVALGFLGGAPVIIFSTPFNINLYQITKRVYIEIYKSKASTELIFLAKLILSKMIYKFLA